MTNVMPIDQVYVVTAAQYRSLVAEQLPELSLDHIITEPLQRDTGPCVALSAQYFLRREDDEVLVMMPSDHHIPHVAALIEALGEAEAIANESSSIVTLGIKPARPETNYGYILAGPSTHLRGAQKVVSFVEKPDIETARRLIAREDVYWNSGIIVWKPSTIAAEMGEHQPELWDGLLNAGDEVENAYSLLPKISIDYAILEKSDHLYTIPFGHSWEDLGSWASLERIREEEADRNGNIVHGVVHAFDSNRNIVFSEGRKTIVIGADDLIIVSTAEGLLVCHKSKESILKSIIQDVENRGGVVSG
jgi:mannose-1-phosphate guanylyltransferase